MQTQTAFTEFFEDINDALREAVRQLGGNKKVGALLRPELPLTQAESWMRHSLSADRREKLSPEQVLFILAEARKVGYHGAMAFVTGHCGYEEPRPVDLDRRTADLQAQILDGIARQNELLAQLQALQAMKPATALRSVG